MAKRPTKQGGSCIFAGKHSVSQAHKLAGKRKGEQLLGTKGTGHTALWGERV